MEGFVFANPVEPSYSLPEDWSEMNIALRLTGGIGDVIVAIGSTARFLKSKECNVIAYVKEHHIEFVEQLQGVDQARSSQRLNDPVERGNYDVLIEFRNVFNGPKYLKSDNYHDLVSEKIGHTVEIAKFKFASKDSGVHPVALHTGASNPNRRWHPEKKWQDLAYEIVERGYDVVFLGTRDEFGFKDKHIHKLSNKDSSILGQMKQLAKCSFFVGNDSGFAHAAGILGIPGVVLFGNTSARDVIGKYPTLKGLEVFDDLGVIPTRSLKLDDSISQTCMYAITPKKVMQQLEACGLKEDKTRWVTRKPKAPKKYKLFVGMPELGIDRKYVEEELGKHFEVTVKKHFPRNIDTYDAVLIIKPARKSVNVDRSTQPPTIFIDTERQLEFNKRLIREVIESG